MKSQFAVCDALSNVDYKLLYQVEEFALQLGSKCACDEASLFRISRFSDILSYHLSTLT